MTERTAFRTAQLGAGRWLHLLVGCQIFLQLLATRDRDPRRKPGWQPPHRPRPQWTPFLFTPPLPDNSSGHAVEGAVAAEVLARFFSNDDIPFTTTSGAPFPGIIRSFNSFSQAAQENADSRLYAGIHFRATTEDGLEQGEKVGRYVFRNFLTPVRGQFD